MQKRVMFIAFLLLAICNKIVADDQLTASNVSMYPGDSKEVSVVLTNDETYVGFQFDLYLPDGLTVESFSGNSNRLPEGTTPQMAQQSDGSYRFVVAALGGNPIAGNDGPVLTLTVKAGDSIAANAYTGYLRNIKISKADGSGVVIAEQPFTVTIAERPKVANVVFAQNGYIISLSTTTEGATIRYNLSNGGAGEQTYSMPLTMTGDCTITAYAMKDGFNASDTTVYTFIAADVTVATPTFSQTGNVVTISTATSGASIYYTTDGTTPTTASNAYPAGGITVTSNMTIKAIAVRDNWFSSAVGEYHVNSFKVADVQFAQSGNMVTLSTTTANAKIFYTLSNNGGGEQEYTAPLTMTGDCTIEAWATRDGYLPSDTTSFVFHAGGVTCSNPVLARTEGTNVVTATTTTEGATIYYTVDGSDPSEGSAVFPTEGLTVSRNQTIKAIAMRQNYYPSQVTTFEVDWFKVANVAFAQNGYRVTLSTTTEGATIRYNLSNGGTGEQTYNSPLTMTGDCTITAYAMKDGFNASDTTAYTFIASDVTVATPTFNLTGNVVTITTTTENATIYYTTDGTTPTTASNAYPAGGITVTSNVTIKAIAVRDNWFNSAVAEYHVNSFKVSNVQFAQSGNMVTLSTTTANAKIFYTLSKNGGGEQEYTAPLTMTGDCTIEAWATRDGYLPSDTTSFVFHAGGVTCSNPVFARNGNVINISTQTDGASIYYTIDGTDPTEQSILYTEAITVDHNMTIKAIAMRQNYYSSQIETFMVDWFKCEMPTIISWSGDTLRAVSATEDAIVNCILRQTSDGPVAQWSGGPDPQLTLPIESDLFVELFATKEGLLTSDTLKFYYPYTAWHQLADAINDANTVLAAAANNDNVTDADRNALSSLIEAAQQSYAARTETESAVKARTDELVAQTAIVRQLVEAVNEPYAVLSENNTVLTFYYDKKKEERGGMDVVPFNDINQRGWHEQRENITRVVFDDSFADCDTLTSTASWFAECGNLTTIENLNLLKTANVENMSSMFWNCSSLTSLDLSNFNTANVTNMHDMFWGCSSLTSLDLSNFNTSNVTIMDGLFEYCSGLSSVSVSNFNTTNVTNMMFMFDGCSSLTSLDVSNFNTANVTEMTSMFADCHSLTILDLSNFNTANVTSMWSMFWGNSSLETIFVGDGWSMEKVENSTTMFNGCTALRGGAGTTYSEEHIDGTYAHIDGGVSNPGYFTDKNAPVIDDNIIQFADAAVKAICVEKWDADGDGELSKAEAAAVTSLNKAFNQNVDIISFEEFRYFTGVTMLVEWEFYNCSNLKKIVLPPHLQSIEDHAFYYCGIDSIVLPASVTNITDAGMYGCFKNIDVDADNPMFCSIDGVLFSKDATVIRNYPVRRYDESYTVPSTVTAIGGCAFYGSRLREIVVPDGVTRFEAGAFRYCRELENIVIPATVDSIFNENFQYCDALTSVMIPANVKYMADDVLSVCSNLKEILVDVDNQNYRSLDGVLYDKDVTRLRIYPANYQTESYVVPDDVTSMYLFAFNRAKNIQAITLPQSLTNISRFDDSKNLTSVTVHWQEPLTLGANTDYFHENTLTNGTLYVPYGTKSLYEQTEGWNKFQNIVEMEAPAVNATFDNHGVLTVGGTATMTEALETVGGVSVVAETITAIVWNSTATLTNSDLQGLDNPNMLVYVQSASQAPANRDNVVIGNDSTGYTAKNIKLKDVAEGNGDFYCPIAFTAEMISYTHEYRQQTEVGVSRGWETIAMPFTVQTIMHETKGLITPFGTDSINKHFWLRQLTQQGLAQARRIEANTPYLISMPNSDAYSAEFNLNGRVTFSSQNAEVPVTQLNGMEVQTATGDMVLLQPNFKGQSATAMIYALNVGEQRDGHPEGSVFVANDRSVRPFEAFTVHHGNGPAPQFISVSAMNGDVTGIEDVRGLMSDGRGDNWYDLNGRRLQQKPTKKGIYIQNGKKTIIK